ncbi:MAG TPA: hypothetical protein VMJ90_00810 [Anaerolineales bacterium]|nr:hypothetical protein [Anaerolineales bacterium]
MKKIFPALVVLLLLGACSFNFPIPGLATPTAMIAITIAPPLPTASPLPTATPVLANPSDTSVPPTLPLPADTATQLTPNLTATFATATEGTLNPTTTPNQPIPPGLPTASPTLGIRLYGTLPPSVPFTDITLVNQARAEAYISLQVTMNDGRYSILEYPVRQRVKVKAPLGSYVYVAWIGGAKFVGSFRLSEADSLTIYLYRDKVVIR